jgi:hypothetical protein
VACAEAADEGLVIAARSHHGCCRKSAFQPQGAQFRERGAACGDDHSIAMVFPQMRQASCAPACVASLEPDVDALAIGVATEVQASHLAIRAPIERERSGATMALHYLSHLSDQLVSGIYALPGQVRDPNGRLHGHHTLTVPSDGNVRNPYSTGTFTNIGELREHAASPGVTTEGLISSHR